MELLWKLSPVNARKETDVEDNVAPLWRDPTRQDSPLHRLCDLLPEACPYLANLYISFQCWLTPGSTRGDSNDSISEMETIFLGPVERMLRAFGPAKGKEFNVAIQVGAWNVLLKKYSTLLGTALRVESEDGLIRGRFWKTLRPPDGSHHDTSGAGDATGSPGYWICGGWDDMEGLGGDYWIVANWGGPWAHGQGTTF